MKTKSINIQDQILALEEMWYSEEDGWEPTGRVALVADPTWKTTDDIDYDFLRESAHKHWGKGWLAIRFALVNMDQKLPQGMFWSQDETDQYRFHDWEPAE